MSETGLATSLVCVQIKQVVVTLFCSYQKQPRTILFSLRMWPHFTQFEPHSEKKKKIEKNFATCKGMEFFFDEWCKLEALDHVNWNETWRRDRRGQRNWFFSGVQWWGNFSRFGFNDLLIYNSSAFRPKTRLRKSFKSSSDSSAVVLRKRQNEEIQLTTTKASGQNEKHSNVHLRYVGKKALFTTEKEEKTCSR